MTDDPFMRELEPKPKTDNRPGSLGWCGMCDNTGWCELKGTTEWARVTYERGCAPCAWCQKGEVIGACLISGIDMHWGKGTPKEDRSKRIPDALLQYAATDVDSRTVSTERHPSLITWEKYKGSPAGQADPNVALMDRIVAGTNKDQPTKRMPGLREDARPPTPSPTDDPFQVRKADV